MTIATELNMRESHRLIYKNEIKKLNIIPVPNPPFPYEFGDIDTKHYGDRVNYMYPARDFIDKGIVAAAGSDSPITDYNPLKGIHTAVNRKSHTGTEIGAIQSISVEEAIKLYTWNGAYASFDEESKGSIEVGKLADLVVLNDSILKVNQNEIKDLKIETTMIDGEIVYSREKILGSMLSNQEPNYSKIQKDAIVLEQQKLLINGERLTNTLEEFANFGRTENNGVTRLALTEEDLSAREYFISCCKELGMTIEIDDMGNIYDIGRVLKTNRQSWMGSHLDSVKKGGRFDGVLGSRSWIRSGP